MSADVQRALRQRRDLASFHRQRAIDLFHRGDAATGDEKARLYAEARRALDQVEALEAGLPENEMRARMVRKSV